MRYATKALLLGFLAACIAVSPANAQEYLFAVDVPSDLGGSTFTPWSLADRTATGYVESAALPAPLHVASLHREQNGDWLFSVRWPVDLGGTTYEPRDVVRWDGSSFSLEFDGEASDLPPWVTIDALYRSLDNDELVLSVDSPVEPNGDLLAPADLFQPFDGFSKVFEAKAFDIAPELNLVAATMDPESGNLLLAFDLPGKLLDLETDPGEIVSWDGNQFQVWAADPAWPAGSTLAGLSPVEAAGETPSAGGGMLRLERLTPTRVRLTWGASCSGADIDYAVYSGDMSSGIFTGHEPNTCSTAGATSWEMDEPEPEAYFLVTAQTASREGSYGRDSAGGERPASLTACAPRSAPACP
ncbi:hypothetical protein ABI59_14360 [Acidobacteria bacterium Mor1]|nr:hypothetical protein ABI59_14360 [Acidobacteria bacterium Mor1]